MRKKIYYWLVLLSILIACKQKQTAQNYFDPRAPKVVAANGYVVPDDSMAPPKVLPVVNVKKTPAGKPKVIPVVSNEHSVGRPKKQLAGKPLINTPGQGKFQNPQVVPVIKNSFPAGLPEIILAKDASVRDLNPENFSSFKILQGLKQPLIRSMIQDNSGNIWFGTYSGGVSKYDGKFFTNYTMAQGLPNDGVWSMLQDRNDNLWFGTYGGGVCKYDGKNFSTYNSPYGLNKDVIWCMLEDKRGSIWLGTNRGVTKYETGKKGFVESFCHYTVDHGLCNNSVRCMMQDRKGNIWIGTQGGGVSKFDGNSFVNFNSTQGIGNDSVLSILEDAKGDIWLGTNGGVTKYDGSFFTHYTTLQGLSNNVVTSIYEDQNGNLWLGTNGGITKKLKEEFRHSESGDEGIFTIYTAMQGLGNDKVTSILEDKSGNLWFGTNGGGASRYDGRLFTHYTTAQGLCHNEVMRTVEDKNGTFWFGTWGGGISRYDGKTFENYTSVEGLNNDNVYSMLLDRKGNLWIGNQQGIDMFDGKSFTHYAAEQGFSNDQVWSIYEDKNGSLWFGTFGDGAIKYEENKTGEKTFIHYTTKQGLSNGIVMSIMEDRKGNLWFGTFGGGASKYDGKHFTHLSTAQGLSNDEVMPMMEDNDGNIWFGTIGGGVNKYDGKTFTIYSTPQGLSNEIIMGILQDKNGTLWFSTRNGLNKMIRPDEDKNNKGAPLFRNYLFADGFLGVNCYVNSLLQDSKENIWIGTGDRLTCYHPQGEIRDTISPNIQLSGVSLFNENINWTGVQNKTDTTLILGNGVSVTHIQFDSLSKWYSVPQNLLLDYNNNYLTFKFIGITTKSPYKINYQYKLDGMDENWNSVSDRTEAPYGNLPPGKYTFKVKAMNSEGYWSSVLSYPFAIRPPWWQRLWFRLTVLACALIVLYGFYRYRLNQILRLQLIRNKIASDLHDDIGSTLNSISVYSEVALQKSPAVVHELNEIGIASRKIVDAMSDIVWTINPKNDSFEQIILRLRSITYNLLKAKNIEHTFHADERINHMKLTMEDRRNFYLIFKEALNNLVKYSGASNATISLLNESNFITLHIADNGIGFDAKQSSAGNGLFNMKNRAMEMNAELMIESQTGKGTTINLKLKV